MDAYYAQSGRRLKGGGSGESAPTGPGSDTTLQSIYLVLQILATGGLDLSVMGPAAELVRSLRSLSATRDPVLHSTSTPANIVHALPCAYRRS